MTRWIGIVVASPEASDEEMVSRLPTYLHPVAGRPLIWHTIAALAQLETPPERILVVTGVELSEELFRDLGLGDAITVLRSDELDRFDHLAAEERGEVVLVIDAAASAPDSALQALLNSSIGGWLGGRAGPAAALLSPELARQLLGFALPFERVNGLLHPQDQLPYPYTGTIVRDRVHFAQVSQRVRDRLVRSLMEGGVTFLLPETVYVDVDVRVGRDSIIYPGVVLEGQTTIGAETVIGPGCRIIDSFVGSGVELKGWNYVSHTSIRNRAILEPYIRRGFD